MVSEQMRSESGPIISLLSEDNQNSLFYFYNEPKPDKTCILDINNLTKNTLEIHSVLYQKKFWVLCSLPNNKVLCIWQNKNNSEFLFSLDPKGNVFNYKSFSRQAISKSKIAVYYKNDKVFIFGQSKWYKLDIYRNIYYSIVKGTKYSYYSCVLLNDYVILSKENPNHIFDVYDILTNTKSTMNIIELGIVKHLFLLNEILYAADAFGYLFSFSMWNINEWEFIGFIKRWQIDKINYWSYWLYWLYCNNEAYIRTPCLDIMKFSMKQNKLNLELITTSPDPQKEIHELDTSLAYEKVHFNILPIWKKRINRAIVNALKLFWYFIAIEKEHLALFPLILEKHPGRESSFYNLDPNSRVNYFFELFTNKNPQNIKIVILIAKPKNKLIDFSTISLRINAIRAGLDSNKNLSKLRKNIVVLSPIVVMKHMSNETLNIFNEFMIETTKILNSMLKKAVFMLWGKEARKCSEFIDQSKHLLIKNSNLISCNDYKKFVDAKNFESAYSYLNK